MPKFITAGFASSDARFRAAIEWREATRRRRPNLEDAILDRAYDALVDTLLIHPELGNSGRAVWALANQQLGWKINSTIRGRFLPDGNRRRTPAGAVPLNALRPAPRRVGGTPSQPATPTRPRQRCGGSHSATWSAPRPERTRSQPRSWSGTRSGSARTSSPSSSV